MKQKNKAILIVFVLAAIIMSVLQTSAESQTIPSNFKITAEYQAGYSFWKSWLVTITADGQGTQVVYGDEDKLKILQFSGEDLKDLSDKVEEADFFRLKDYYSYNVTDLPTLILTVTKHEKTHRVEVYAVSFLKENDDVQGFLKIWREVLKKVPSPNPEQKPEIYT